MLLVAFKVPLCVPAFEEGELLTMTGFDRPNINARRRLHTLDDAFDDEGFAPKPPPRAPEAP